MANTLFLVLILAAVIVLPLLGIPIIIGFIIYKILKSKNNQKGPAEGLDEEQVSMGSE